MIQGIGYNDLYNSYNRIQYPKYNEESLKNLNQGNGQVDSSAQVNVKPSPVMDLKLDSIKPRANASIEDISLSLNKPSEFEMKGRESDINELDITKAVSDMQKDGALQQYQYFVGSENPMFQSEDGVVIPKVSM